MFLTVKKVLATTSFVLLAAGVFAAENVRDLDRVKGRDFFTTSSGTIGIVSKTSCNRDEPLSPGSFVRLIGGNNDIWGIRKDTRCIRFIINHKAVSRDEPSSPSYIGIKVVALFEEEGRSQIINRSEGSFYRGNSRLPSYEYKVRVNDEAARRAQAEFDDLHKKGDLDGVDKLIGKWHGVPENGNHDTWDLRDQLITELPKVAKRTQWNSRVTDYRLYRFTPFVGKPKSGLPVDAIVFPKEAEALVVKFYSPIDPDFGGEFVVFMTDDEDELRRLSQQASLRKNKSLIAYLFGSE